jgi:hypothetical protein
MNNGWIENLADTARPLLGKTLYRVNSDRKPDGVNHEIYNPGVYYGNLRVRFFGENESLTIVEGFGRAGLGGPPYSYLELHGRSLRQALTAAGDDSSGHSTDTKAVLCVFPLAWPELFSGGILTEVWVNQVNHTTIYSPPYCLCGIILKFERAAGLYGFMPGENSSPLFLGTCFDPFDEEGTSWKTILGQSLPDLTSDCSGWVRVAKLEVGERMKEPPELPDHLLRPRAQKHIFKKFIDGDYGYPITFGVFGALLNGIFVMLKEKC